MLIFFFLVITYSAANYYLFSSLSTLTGAGGALRMFMGLVITFMTLSPLILPFYSHRGSERVLTVYSYTAYLWLAFVVPFFTFGVVLELYNFLLRAIGYVSGYHTASLALSSQSVFFVSFFLSIAIDILGYFEAGNLQIERIVMYTQKLPEGADRVRVAQISDLHLGVIVRDRTVEKIIEIVNAEAPDIIVSTGDLVDGITLHVEHLADKLITMRAPLGKFAVIGNHEVYGGLKKTAAFIKTSGFTLLRGRGVTPGGIINIAGMDFTGAEVRRQNKDASRLKEREILAALPPGLFTLLLKHRSDVEKESLGLFDLQLSGHTHKGQIFPMNLATMFLFPYHTGYTKLSGGSAIYVSRGTGTSGPPIRFLSKPEITVIDIIKTKSLLSKKMAKSRLNAGETELRHLK